uniref:ULP_PROTEASE domain-containing protein n=1 Tax=Macrostomum lignano TaxID=282301 RepID=A0A1I8FDA4_9PLAT
MFANSRLKPWCFVNKISYEMRMLWDYCEISNAGAALRHYLTRHRHTRTPTRNLRACQCFNESEIPDPAADFQGRYIDQLAGNASGVNKPGHQQSADVQQEFALQWIIFDIGSHKHISLLKLFINRMDLSAMRFLEVFVRGAPLPHWLVETDFRSSDGRKGRRTEYFRRATMAEKMLWWHCEDLKISSRCGPAAGGAGVHADAPPQFTLPLTTHDSVHPDERFLQEDWDAGSLRRLGDHEGHHIVGVPSKLKLTISEEHPRGQSCYEPGPNQRLELQACGVLQSGNDTLVLRLAVDMQNCQFCLRRFQGMQSFRILAEFLLPAAFHQLQSEHDDVRVRERHRLWQKVRHHDHFEPVHVEQPVPPVLPNAAGPAGMKRPASYHLLCDNSSADGSVLAKSRRLRKESQPQIGQQSRVLFRPRRPGLPAASSIPHHIAAILGGSFGRKIQAKKCCAQSRGSRSAASQVSDPQPAAPAAAPQAVTSSAAEELPASVGLRLGAAAARRPPAAHHRLGAAGISLLIQPSPGIKSSSCWPIPAAIRISAAVKANRPEILWPTRFWMPTDEGVLAAAAAAASTEPLRARRRRTKDSSSETCRRRRHGSWGRRKIRWRTTKQRIEDGPRSSSANCSALVPIRRGRRGEDATGKY